MLRPRHPLFAMVISRSQISRDVLLRKTATPGGETNMLRQSINRCAQLLAGGFIPSLFALWILGPTLLSAQTAPTQPAADHVKRGLELYRNHDTEGAIGEYRSALRLDPSNATAHFDLALALQAGGDLQGSIAELRETLRLA